ncbi:hypothetical protein SLS56_003659 [Neofusicoccum ribis]|uniref:Uncharacterized protein n=1 Tax=Neofusicoccum ribis TaxID=45134 RepID=A0ABR3SZ87_9PEZI
MPARRHIGTAEPRMTTSNYTTFRLSGIPGTYKKHDVKNLLYQGLQYHSELEDDVQIRSLAMDPSGMGHKVATLTLPQRLVDLVRLDPETQSLLLHVPDDYGG